MNDEQLDDLKQFIDSRISQTEQLIRTDMSKGFVEINKKMDDGFSGVGDAIEEIHVQIDTTNAPVDKRLTKLEQQAA